MELLRIRHLTVQNIGPFGNLDLAFPPKPSGMEGKAEVHILTGENGSGKTTVLEALAAGVSHNASPFFHRKSRKKTPRSTISVHFDEGSESSFAIENGTNHTLSRNQELKAYWFAHGNYAANRFSTAFFAYSGYRRVEHTKISAIQELPNHPFENALDFQNSINPQRIIQWIANNISKEAIEKSQGNEAKAARYRDSIGYLEKAVSDIIEKPLRFLLETEVLNVVVEVDGETLDFNLLPDGLKSIVSWIADLLMRMDRVHWENDLPVFERSFILFLDEIEVHMHPAWQRKILPAAQRLFPNAQILVSTHSPFVVGSVDGAWIHKLVKPNGDSQLAEGYPKISEDAKSYGYWLNEVFGIRTQFGPEVQHSFDAFYALRNRVLQHENGTTTEQFLHSGRALANQSSELNQIIEMEIRQVNRRLGLQLSL